jgi:ADP-glucose pyrophosphorylase
MAIVFHYTPEEQAMYSELEEWAEQTAYSLYQVIKLIDSSTKDCKYFLEHRHYSETDIHRMVESHFPTFEEVKAHLEDMEFRRRRLEEILKEDMELEKLKRNMRLIHRRIEDMELRVRKESQDLLQALIQDE